MRCQECGTPIPDGSTSCPRCGAPIALDETVVMPSDTTRVIRRPARQSDKTQVAPTPAQRTQRRVQPTSDHQERFQSQAAPTHQRRNAILIALAAALGIVTFVSTLLLLRPEVQTPPQTSPAKNESSETAQAPQEGQESAGEQEQEEADSTSVDSGGSRAGGPGEESSPADEATLDEWASTASDFMHILPANCALSDDGEYNPNPIDVDEWAQMCLGYVYPGSDLASQLESNPYSLVAQLELGDAMRLVTDVQVVSTSELGVNGTVSVDEAQDDWGAATSHTEEYLVQFSPSGQVTNVGRIQ